MKTCILLVRRTRFYALSIAAPRSRRRNSGRCSRKSEVKVVRYSAWCLAASLLVYVSTSQAQVAGTNAQDRPARSDLAAGIRLCCFQPASDEPFAFVVA